MRFNESWKQLLAFSSKGEMDGDVSLPLSLNFCFPSLGDGTDRSSLSMHLLFQEYQWRILFLFAAFLAKINFVPKIIGSLTLLAQDLTAKFFIGDIIGISKVNVKMIGNFMTNCQWSEPLMWPNRRLVRK